MDHPARAAIGASLLVLAAPALAVPRSVTAPAAADDPRADAREDILVVARKQRQSIENAPATTVSIDAERIATTINAVNVEDAVKYLPSLIVRKRHIGDMQAPLATRTTGLGASARSLIYADGALLSALIGNNNTSASPRWGLVSPQEVASIDVLYGPFSAAYPGNSIGAVVSITTRLPDRLEATANAGVNVQRFDQYDTRAAYPSYQGGATIGDRFGPLAVFASVDHVASRGQPLLYVTAARPGSTGAAGVAAVGGFDDVNRTGAPIRVLGASGIERQRQDRVKLKAALDLGAEARLTYVGALFLNHTDAGAETYLATVADGQPAYAGALRLDGRPYALAASAFSGGIYRADQRHGSHVLSLTGTTGHTDWQVIATRYRFDTDVQRSPSTALPAAAAGGAGTITRLDGTGWTTLDAKASWRGAGGAHVVSIGAHGDLYRLESGRYATGDWLTGREGALTLRSAGRTRTGAVWLQDAWRPARGVTATIGGRQEWWRAYDGINLSLSPELTARQPERRIARFSPKAALAWTPSTGWTVRASYGEAWRFPTVGELYQLVTTPIAAVPDPTLMPERARSEELAVERRLRGGSVRVSLFNEDLGDALVSQTGPLNGGSTLATFVQNVGRTQTRGVEAAWQVDDLIRTVDLSGSVTYADAVTREDAALPAAVGRRVPGIPAWKATLVATWRPAAGVSVTAAGRYASRIYGTLDNSDVVGNTYQGFYRYLVVDLRAAIRVGEGYTLGLGVDNVGGERYFLFHPFPQRSFQIDLTWRS